MFRFFILGIIVSNTVLGQSVECCPSEPKVQTGRYAIKPNCSVKFFGNWGSSGSSSVQLTGFDVSHDSSFNSFIRLNAGTIRTFFTTSTAFSDSTKYYRAFAKNRTHIAYGDVLEMNPMDFNGNSYQAVAIGSQTWLVENLKSTFYQNGDSIQKH